MQASAFPVGARQLGLAENVLAGGLPDLGGVLAIAELQAGHVEGGGKASTTGRSFLNGTSAAASRWPAVRRSGSARLRAPVHTARSGICPTSG